MSYNADYIGGLTIGSIVRTSSWIPYSNYHLFSAYHFAQSSKILEERYKSERKRNEETLRGQIFNKYHNRHRAFVTSSIICSAAFLEAFINEVFLEMRCLPNGEQAAQIEDTIKDKLISFCEKEDNRSTGWEYQKIIDKYSSALEIIIGTKLNKGGRSAQDVKILLKLRNELVHYKPQKIQEHSSKKKRDGTKKQYSFDFDELERQKRFSDNVLFEGGNNYFPDRCLGSGCAFWVADSALKFVDEFYLKLGIIPKSTLERFKNDAIDSCL
jgi:hypothetical protein